MLNRKFVHLIISAQLVLLGATSMAWSKEWNYHCDGWVPASLQLRGPVTLLLSDQRLTWSNGRKNYVASFVDGVSTRKTFADNASVYIVYGLWVGTTSTLPRLKIVRIFYNSAINQISELTCQES